MTAGRDSFLAGLDDGKALLTAAVEYAAAGLPVLPLHSMREGRCSCGKACSKPAKHPRTEHGLLDATTDVERVAEWWRRWPDANIGIPTGQPSGLVVLDVDTPKGGARSLAELERKHGKLERTAETLTGSGGRHLVFRRTDVEIRNSEGKLGPGLDVRGDGGYVVAPPSIHESGRAYQWTRQLDRGLADPPGWLIEDAEQRRNGPAPTVEEAIPEGRRNGELASIAGTLRRRGLGETEIAAALLEVNRQRCSPPLGEDEVRKIAASVSRYEPGAKQTPDPPPDPPGSPVVRLDTLGMRSVQWLDKPFLQRSAFHLYTGPKGVGKGTHLARMIAAMTLGGYPCGPRNVLVIASEDDPEIDLKPRLVAAGADETRVWVVRRNVVLPNDLLWLRDTALEIGDVGLIVIDPVGNHLGGVDTDKEGLIRHALAGLNGLATALDCAIIGVRHLKKDRSGGALASVLGSTAWVDLPRTVVAFARDDEDEMLYHVQVVAGNRSGRGKAQKFEITTVELPGLDEPVTKAVTLGEGKDVDDLLAARPPRESASRKARDIVLEVLETEGDQESDALDARVAGQAGCAARTVMNVRKELVKAGLIRSIPVTDDHGTVVRWKVSRTLAGGEL